MYLSIITYGLFLSAVALSASIAEFHVFIFAFGEWITMYCSEIFASHMFLVGILSMAGILFGAVFTLLLSTGHSRASMTDVAVQTDSSNLVPTLHLPDQIYASRKVHVFIFVNIALKMALLRSVFFVDATLAVVAFDILSLPGMDSPFRRFCDILFWKYSGAIHYPVTYIYDWM